MSKHNVESEILDAANRAIDASLTGAPQDREDVVKMALAVKIYIGAIRLARGTSISKTIDALVVKASDPVEAEFTASYQLALRDAVPGGGGN